MDRDLVERARRGDRDAFATLVHRVSDGLYAIAFRMLRDTGLAEDALQNALVTAWRQIPHLRDPERFEAWMYRVLVNSLLRRGSPEPSLDRQRPGPPGARRAVDARREPRRRRPRRARPGVPQAPDRPAVGVRPAPLRRAAAGGDRRDARHPRGHGPLATPLRDPGAAIGRRGRSRSCPSRKDARHDRRPPLRAQRARLARARTGRGTVRRRPGGPPRDRHDPQERDVRVPWRFRPCPRSRGRWSRRRSSSAVPRAAPCSSNAPTRRSSAVRRRARASRRQHPRRRRRLPVGLEATPCPRPSGRIDTAIGRHGRIDRATRRSLTWTESRQQHHRRMDEIVVSGEDMTGSMPGSEALPGHRSTARSREWLEMFQPVPTLAPPIRPWWTSIVVAHTADRGDCQVWQQTCSRPPRSQDVDEAVPMSSTCVDLSEGRSTRTRAVRPDAASVAIRIRGDPIARPVT